MDAFNLPTIICSRLLKKFKAFMIVPRFHTNLDIMCRNKCSGDFSLISKVTANVHKTKFYSSSKELSLDVLSLH